MSPPVRARAAAGRARWWRLGAGVVVLAAGVVVWKFGFGGTLNLAQVRRLEQWFRELGPLGPVVFIAGYAIAELFFVPALPLTIFGGVVFGPVLGSVAVSIGAIAGAALAFLAARYAMRDMVVRWTMENARLGRIDRAVTEHGWRVLMVTRLVPLFPFNLQNFAYGLTGIRFWPFIGVSWICILPGTIAYTLAGSALAEGRGNPRRTLLYVGAAGLLIVALSLLPRWLGRHSRVLGDLTGRTPESRC